MSRSSGMPSWEDLTRGMINYYEQLFQNTEDDVKAKVEQLKKWIISGMFFQN